MNYDGSRRSSDSFHIYRPAEPGNDGTPAPEPWVSPDTSTQQILKNRQTHHISLPPMYYTEPPPPPGDGSMPSWAAEVHGAHQGVPAGTTPSGTYAPRGGVKPSLLGVQPSTAGVQPPPPGPGGALGVPMDVPMGIPGAPMPGNTATVPPLRAAPVGSAPVVSPMASAASGAGTGVPSVLGVPHVPGVPGVSGIPGIPVVPRTSGAAGVGAAASTPGGISHGVPRLRNVRSWSQLKPVVIKAPKTRRAKPDGGFMSPLVALTTYLPATYGICDPKFQYSQERNPRRVLTEPNEPVNNSGYDNADNDYVLYVNDILGTDENRRYLVLNLLGKGTFGQVVKCQNMATMEVVAVKVIKNKPTFLNQSMMEVSILEWIQQSVDQSDEHNLVRLRDKFMHKDHLCLVFDLLSSNLYEVIKKNKFWGLGINVVRNFATQLLDSLAALKSASLIHCDLKPENILLKRPDSLNIKVIDFGSACHERQTVYTYIQSRFYRSPEVILGLPYTSSIDMWSLGCIVAELFLGLPIFPGSSEYNQWSRIVESLGLPPSWMLDMGKNTSNCMVKLGPGHWALRSLEEQNRLFNTNEKVGQKYFASPNIHDTIMSYPFPRKNMTPAEIKEELKERESLSDFVRGLLNFNPFERWTPHQAAMHPFIKRQRFVGPYSPQQTTPLSVPHGLQPPLPPGLQPQPQPQPQPQLQPQPHIQPQPQLRHKQPIAANSLPFPAAPQPFPAASQALQLPNAQAFPYRQRGANQSYQALNAYVPLANTRQQKHNALRGRSATIGQVNNSVPAQIQQAAALVDPNDVIQGHSSPAYFPPPSNFYQRQN